MIQWVEENIEIRFRGAVYALLIVEWGGEFKSCPACCAYRDDFEIPIHRIACPINEALRDLGFNDQKSRDSAREEMSR